MEINQLNLESNKINTPKLNELYSQFQEILEKLNDKKLPSEALQYINNIVEQTNSTTLQDTALLKFLKDKQNFIIKYLEKEHKIVPKSYYKKLWLAVGMTAFGLPIGVVFGLLMGNIGLMAIGLPIGLGVGAVVSSSMDKKALQEGRQIDVEMKF
ncbi:hypothetical protein DRF62_03490 [Chryseobacterium piscium]|uniref:Glycine zipper family protein n=1 Tax=Chryseobacterium piscium TaxID=333702 RepID=A0A3D9BS93_9FLAO|nr:hypothetical protein [Chryseobacterium piscium]REC56380.1 hypothetical protein DRF62_03490 [Chryseobacterium piscium]